MICVKIQANERKSFEFTFNSFQLSILIVSWMQSNADQIPAELTQAGGRGI
jgi:hypothetical protein